MKFVVGLFTVITLAPIFSSAADQCEIHGVVAEFKSDHVSSCHVKLNPDSLNYSISGVDCPALNLILEIGIELPLSNGHDCEIHAGANIFGNLILGKDGKVYLD
jgi:hypothetical protein